MALPLRIFLRFLVSIGLVAGMTLALPQYVEVQGGLRAFVIIGALITILNLFLRPVLQLITFPLKLFAMILAMIVVNGVFLWAVVDIVGRMSPAIVQFHIRGGLIGWIIVAIVFGVANWLMKELLR